MIRLRLDELESPLGAMLIVSDSTAVRAVDFFDYRSRMERLLTRHYGRFTLDRGIDQHDVRSRFSDYFAGDLSVLDTIPTATNGTEFQQRVWTQLRMIPPGTTVSYGWIAQRINQPGAARAVGLANGSNPIAIIVPCHRVIGANRSLTGYGGGLERKRWLLSHECHQDSRIIALAEAE